MQMPFSKLAKRSEMGNKAKRLVISRYGCVCICVGTYVSCVFLCVIKKCCAMRETIPM